jgi:cytochrome b involved in lipid metabolism
MKKTVGISLFIFFAIVVAILVAGLVFYQKNINNTNTVVPVNNVISRTNSSKPNSISTNTKPAVSTSSGIILNMTEVAKHNKKSDCYIVISNKVYNITSYFGSHPGGNSTMTATCGTDATQAYNTKGGNGSPHSTRAVSLLANYYLGNLIQ